MILIELLYNSNIVSGLENSAYFEIDANVCLYYYFLFNLFQSEIENLISRINITC